MNIRPLCPAGAVLALLSACASAPPAASTAAPARAGAVLTVADPFSQEMVLQRGVPVPVWGSADPGAPVTVRFAGQAKTAAAGPDGRWQVVLDPMPACADNRTLTVETGGKTLAFKDVLVGEVWLCSGQSNMQWGLDHLPTGAAEIAAADHPLLRLCHSNLVLAPLPQDRHQGSPWQACTPQTLAKNRTGHSFSATAYFFGRDLQRELQVPVGLIQSAWGGTLIEPWTTPEGFRSQPKLKAQSDWLDQANAGYRADAAAYLAAQERWQAEARLALADGHALPPPPALAPPRHPIHANSQPTALYNAMIAPWARFPVRGAIWYQGESNHIQHDGPLYADKLAALAAGWRQAFGRNAAQFPFYAVQIAPFRYGQCAPEELGTFWEAQQRAMRAIPNAGLAHTQDVGDPGNIHPVRKQEVGARLARLALSRTYGAKTQAGAAITDDCGPEFRALSAKDGRLVVAFDHAKSGLATRDGQPPTHFEVAGADGKFAPAQARIDGASVVLSSPQVPTPTAARFAWNDIAKPNLVNGDGLPAASFRADAPESK